MEQCEPQGAMAMPLLVAGVDDLLVADGTARLHDGSHAGAAGALDIVTEGKRRRTREQTRSRLAQR